MKRVGKIIRDQVPEQVPNLEPTFDLDELLAERPAAPEPVKRSGPMDFRAIAEASIAEGKKTGRAQRIEAQEVEQAETRKEARAKLCLQLYVDALPEHYREYVTRAPVRTPGTDEALELIGRLEPGRSLHIWGEDPGNQKSHLMVWAGAEMIRRFGLRVIYLSESSLERMAYQFDEPPLFEDEEVIVADDLDKVMPGERQSKVVTRLLGRPHKRKTLLSSAQRSADDLAALFERDARNLGALASRLYYLKEVEVTGPDYRAHDGPRSWN